MPPDIEYMTNWIEAIAEYKSYLKDIASGKNLNPTGMNNIMKYYSQPETTECL